MRKRNISLLLAPAIALVGAAAWGVFAAGALQSPERLTASDSSPVQRSEAQNGVDSSLSSSDLAIEDLSALLGSTSATDFIESSISCSTLDSEITSQLDFFTYQSRMAGLDRVTNDNTALSWGNNNFDWALPVGHSARYADRSAAYLGEELKDLYDKGIGPTKADWNQLGSELLPQALAACDLEGVFDESLAALRAMDYEIARAIDLLVEE